MRIARITADPKSFLTGGGEILIRKFYQKGRSKERGQRKGTPACRRGRVLILFSKP